jgi:hypothetical protein
MTLPIVAAITLLAADGDLIPLLVVLVDAENADIGDVVVAAGVHAARDVERNVADVVQIVEVVELVVHRRGDRQRAGVGQRAEVAAGAADHVGQQADVGRRQAVAAGDLPDFIQIALPDVGENHVLFVADAQLAEAEAVGEVGDGDHLLLGDVAGRTPGAFSDSVTAA